MIHVVSALVSENLDIFLFLFCLFCFRLFLAIFYGVFGAWFPHTIRTHTQTENAHYANGVYCARSLDPIDHARSPHTHTHTHAHTQRTGNNLDTSVPSIHSSGCDSGVGLTSQLNDASSKHILHMMRDPQRRIAGERCVCGFGAAGPHICSGAEDSR